MSLPPCLLWLCWSVLHIYSMSAHPNKAPRDNLQFCSFSTLFRGTLCATAQFIGQQLSHWTVLAHAVFGLAFTSATLQSWLQILVWVSESEKFAYVADVFSELNRLNISIQGCNTHAIQMYDRTVGFFKKARKLREYVSEGIFHQWISWETLQRSHQVLPTNVSHLQDFKAQFVEMLLAFSIPSKIHSRWHSFDSRGGGLTPHTIH